MQIPGITQGTPAPGQSPTPTAKPSLQDQFLQLLVAQLKQQDPLQPQQGSEFVTQLAQLSSLQQSAQANQTLNTIASNQNGAASASYAGLVGRTVSARSSSVALDGPLPPSLGAHLDAGSAKTQLVITDANGKVVRTIELGARPAGEIDVAWDGLGDGGKPLAPGTYGMALKASDPKGNAITGFTELRGMVTALDFSSGTPRFRVGGTTIAPADVISIK